MDGGVFIFKKSVFAVPAVCAEFAGGKPRGGEHIVEAMIFQRIEFQFAADGFDHRFVFRGIGVCVSGNSFFIVFALHFGDLAPRDQLER